jgi:capsular exopolysaccharide synthesis family protein
MELVDYVRVMRSNWIAITLLTVVSGVIAFGWTLTQDKVYQANSSAIVTAQAGSDLGAALVGENLAKSRISSYLEVAESRAVAEHVISRLHLQTTPEALVGRIDVKNPLDTAILEVKARAGSPEAARALAETWVEGVTLQVKELDSTDASTKALPSAVRLVPLDSAVLPHRPVHPDVPRSVTLGLGFGLLLGIAYALVRQQVDQRIRRAEAVEKTFDIPVLGTLPLAAAAGRDASSAIAPFDARSDTTKGSRIFAESVRALRTNLQFMDVDHPPRIFVLTSPLPGDGKSTVAAQLAMTIAAAGQPVVLVDGDLRRPTVASTFGLVEGVGLTDVLVGRASLADVLQPWGDGMLRILATGPTPPNPSELLGSEAMAQVLTELAADAMVLIDSSPLLPVTDAAILTARTDGALVVVRSGRTTLALLEQALHNLERVNGRALGVIINGSKLTGVSESTYYDYVSRDADAKRPSETS